MSVFSIHFENPWLLLLSVPAAAAVCFSYIRARGIGMNGWQRTVSYILRLTAVLIIILMMAGLRFVTNRADTSLLILADVSDSVPRDEIEVLANDLARAAEKDMRVGVMAFAGDAALEQSFTQRVGHIKPDARLNTEATHIASALSQAAASFPENTRKRIVLLTDGRATDGDAMAAAAALTMQDIRLDAIAVHPDTDAPEVEVTALHLPAEAALGQPFQVGITVLGSGAASGLLRLYEEDTAVREESVSVLPGENTYTFRVTPTGAGVRTYRAELIPDPDTDTLPQNNHALDCLNVISTQNVLLVDGTGAESDALLSLLTENGYTVEVCQSKDTPRTVSALCRYGLVVLLNVNANDLPGAAAAALDEYVSVYGRSVLTAGGGNTYVYGNMTDTLFESFLPITMEVEERESAEPVALMLVIDNSASMEGTAIVMAKRGAIKSIEALNRNDRVGVITFSTGFDVLAEMTDMAHRDEVIAAVSGIGTVMGTVYSGALQAAYERLSAVDGQFQKHVILLSDGNPSDTGYEAIVEQMAEAGITVSTIGVGRDISEELMERLSVLGGGRCYQVSSSYELPSIMMTDTILLGVEYQNEGVFEVNKGKKSVFKGTIPSVTGYIRATQKATAEVLLSTQDRRPLLIQWAYGTGKAVSLMSDLSGRWTADWFAVADGRQAILTLIAGLIPDEHVGSALDVRLLAGGGEGTLRVVSADHVPQSFRAEVTAPDQTTSSLTLTHTGEGVYERTFPLSGFGRYGVVLSQYDEQGTPVNTLSTAVAASWSREYDVLRSAENPLIELQAMCEQTGGLLADTIEQVLTVDTGRLQVTYNPSLILSVALFGAMLADILLRRVRFRRPS